MVKTIVIWILVAAVIIFFIVWALTGGIGRAIKTGKSMLSPAGFFSGNATGTSFTLPWQSSLTPADVDTAEGSFQSTVLTDSVSATPDPNDSLSLEAKRMKTFGNPSPQAGKITIISNSATDDDPSQEFLHIQNSGSAPVSLSGWSVQSVYSPGRIALPNAAPRLVTGTVNGLDAVTLRPGGNAFIVSGSSPVGASFRENKCTGYLAQFQQFNPPLSATCPEPTATLPVSEETLRTFGDDCIDFVRALPVCKFPTGNEIPSTLSPACRAFVMNNFSYNGCVATHNPEPDFDTNDWRLYLNSRTELWRNTHDVIRLLDESGRTVDVLTY